MFESESKLQQLVHEDPAVVLSGIPEISPEYCPDTPSILSLGREIPLSSGPIDNLYIDTNAIITFVECKRYSDARIKREVYAQAINYASDLNTMLSHYTGEQFCFEFFKIISGAMGCPFDSLDSIISQLSDDPILSGKNIQDWRNQFLQRLEYNIKAGIFRVIIACGPSADNAFAYSGVRNLIQLMNYSEIQNNRYDLILMDIRDFNGSYTSKIIWRSYAQLPQIPLIAQAARDTSGSIEQMRNRFQTMPDEARKTLDDLIDFLNREHAYLVENTAGFAIYSEKNKKSLYTAIIVEEGGWHVSRHQIRESENLFKLIKTGQLETLISNLRHTLLTKTTGKGEPMYEIRIDPDRTNTASQIGSCILEILGADHT